MSQSPQWNIYTYIYIKKKKEKGTRTSSTGFSLERRRATHTYTHIYMNIRSRTTLLSGQWFSKQSFRERVRGGKGGSEEEDLAGIFLREGKNINALWITAIRDIPRRRRRRRRRSRQNGRSVFFLFPKVGIIAGAICARCSFRHSRRRSFWTWAVRLSHASQARFNTM